MLLRDLSNVYSAKRLTIVMIGEGISQLQAKQMSHIVTTAQAILGRK